MYVSEAFHLKTLKVLTDDVLINQYIYRVLTGTAAEATAAAAEAAA